MTRWSAWLATVSLAALACGDHAVPAGDGTEEPRTVRTADGAELALFAVGGPHSDTVVIPMASLLMRHLSPLARNHTVVFYDIRGRGRSGPVADTAVLSLARDVEDLEVVRAALALGRFTLVGWSYAGAIAAQYSFAHPEHVDRVVLLSPIAPSTARYGEGAGPAGRDTAAEALLAALQRRDSTESRNVEECRLANRIEAAELIADSTARSRRTDVCALPNEWPANIGRSTFARLGKLRAYDWSQGIASARTPLFVVAGTRDFIPLNAAKAWVAGHEERLTVIQNAGHYSFLEQPDAVLIAIAKSLGE